MNMSGYSDKGIVRSTNQDAFLTGIMDDGAVWAVYISDSPSIQVLQKLMMSIIIKPKSKNLRRAMYGYNYSL